MIQGSTVTYNTTPSKGVSQTFLSPSCGVKGRVSCGVTVCDRSGRRWRSASNSACKVALRPSFVRFLPLAMIRPWCTRTQPTGISDAVKASSAWLHTVQGVWGVERRRIRWERRRRREKWDWPWRLLHPWMLNLILIALITGSSSCSSCWIRSGWLKKERKSRATLRLLPLTLYLLWSNLEMQRIPLRTALRSRRRFSSVPLPLLHPSTPPRPGYVPQSKQYGQPLPSTHPHLLSQGELTPGIQAKEYGDRRRKLMQGLEEGAIVVIAGGKVQYMSQNIL